MTPTPVPLPTLTEVITATSDFVADWAVFIAGGLIIGLAGVALSRLIRAGR